MRIIAGAKRGMKLLSPETRVSRPITDRVKESLFSVLYKYDLPEGKMVADLFCGVGSLGLEALSRGAEFVTFVEKDLKTIAILKKNIEKAGFAGQSIVLRTDAFKIGAPFEPEVRSQKSEVRPLSSDLCPLDKYDLIFVDPPYSATRETKVGSPLSKLLVLLTEQLSPDGIVVVRTERRTRDEGRRKKEEGRINQLPFNQLPITNRCRFEVIERRQWGTMAVTILQWRSKKNIKM